MNGRGNRPLDLEKTFATSNKYHPRADDPLRFFFAKARIPLRVQHKFKAIDTKVVSHSLKLFVSKIIIMKLSIAAGILSAHSTLKVVSEAKPSTWLNSERRPSNGRRFLGQEKNPLSAAIGSTGLVQQEKKNSATLVNSQNTGALWKSSRDKAIECTPEESTEAHVGVLAAACAVDQMCIPSVYSSMGGFCYTAPLTSARSLQTETSSDVCDPTSDYYQICDCSNFDMAAKTGSFACTYTQCLGTYYYGCYDTCFTVTESTSVENGEYISSGLCSSSVVDGDGLILLYCVKFINDGTCEFQMYDQKCTSCTVTDDLLTWDCSNVVDGLTSDASFSDVFPIVQACNKPVNGTDCDLCGDNTFYANDLTPFSLDGFGNALTCSGLEEAETNNLISAEKCPEAAALAQMECCAPPSGETVSPGGNASVVPTVAPNGAPVGVTAAPGEGPEPTAAPGPPPLAVPLLRRDFVGSLQVYC